MRKKIAYSLKEKKTIKKDGFFPCLFKVISVAEFFCDILLISKFWNISPVTVMQDNCYLNDADLHDLEVLFITQMFLQIHLQQI